MKIQTLLAMAGLVFGWVIPDAHAKLNVLTTIPDLRAIAAEVGGEFVDAESIAKGTQDPHYIEAKPSFMVKGSRADLVISIGLDLEIGWLPSVLQGSRNPKIRPGQSGFLEVGPFVQPLEVPVGDISRAQGDVHPSGNPHITLDPIRAGEIAIVIGKRLSDLDPAHAVNFSKNADALQKRLKDRTAEWQERIKKTGVVRIVTFHRTLSYFLNRFGIELTAILEPKPGIPPTSGHIIEVIKTIREKKIQVVLVENYFDSTVTKKIKAEVPDIRTSTVAVAVEGAPGLSKLDDVYENLVRKIEGK
jgi:zinc/manganese transport system substrate-binding protein